ncbi:MAG: DUF1653 domain-containing protein [Burkholderiales bacterium]|nr:MAG: DUF1653 domain-containing protein [Burkholderiales bacterium]
MWQHVATSHRYVVVGTALLQMDGPADLTELVVYRGADGRQWARPVSEFLQRFVQR